MAESFLLLSGVLRGCAKECAGGTVQSSAHTQLSLHSVLRGWRAGVGVRNGG